jgi:PAS domain S-box-containing protein
MISHRDLLRAILDLSDAVITVIDRKGQIVFLSPAFQRLTGRTFEKEKMKSSVEFVHPSEREWVAESIQRSLQGEDIGVVSCRIQRLDGTYARIRLRGKAIHDLSGRVEYLVTMSTPVHED